MIQCLWTMTDECGVELRCMSEAAPRSRAGVDLCLAHEGKFSDQRQSVYLIGNDDMVKIGVSENPRSRLQSLRSAGDKTLAPEGMDRRGLQMLGLASSGVQMERWLHLAFAPAHVVGEWFLRTDEVNRLVAGAGLSPYWDRSSSEPSWVDL